MDLKLDDYPFKTKQILRFGDTDQQGHLNNAVYATFFESGRVALIYDRNHDLPPRGTSFVIAQINIRFIQEILFPGDVYIGTRVTKLGTSSLHLEQGIYANGERCAAADSVVVMTSLTTRRATPIPDAVKQHFSTFQIEAGA